MKRDDSIRSILRRSISGYRGMKKIKFAIVKFGATDHLCDYKTLKSWKSQLFEIQSVYSIDNPPTDDIVDGYWDLKYSRELMGEFITCPDDCDIAVAIMPYRFKDNFYMHRVSSNVAVISLYGIREILAEDDISIENFVLKQFYELTAIKHLMEDISDDAVYDLVHRDTRRCLFDMNGDRMDILYNTEQPCICDECKSKFKKKQVATNVIFLFEKELKKLRKPFVARLEKLIRSYPFISLICSLLSAVLVNILANYICQFI